MANFDPNKHGGENMEALPPDDYMVRIAGCERKPNKDKTAHYIELKLKVAGGDHEGSTFYDTCSLLEQSLWKLGDVCKSIGQTNVFDVDNQNAINNALLGRVGKCRTKWEEYEGQKRTKVAKWVMSTAEDRERHPIQSAQSGDAPDAPSGGGGRAGDNIPF